MAPKYVGITPSGLQKTALKEFKNYQMSLSWAIADSTVYCISGRMDKLLGRTWFQLLLFSLLFILGQGKKSKFKKYSLDYDSSQSKLFAIWKHASAGIIKSMALLNGVYMLSKLKKK